jgi:microcystin-dependent protein
MANQPESPTYDAGVYQIEIVDPVKGGVGGLSNVPLLNLANRTAYLKQHVDNLESGATLPPTVAPLNSPALTGSPTAPTPAAGDSSTKISTTAFVQAAISGIANVNVAGGAGVVLTQPQWGVGIVNFTGALTANINVTFPLNGQWIVNNGTTGAFTLTCKTAAGTGVAITQGATNLIYGDATNIALSKTDFNNAALTGNPTAPTQTVGDNSTKIATTAFVIANAGGASTGRIAQTLSTVPDVGWVMMNDGSIGNGASAATNRAAADTAALFTMIWNNISQANCPVQDNTGATVARGASAAADYAANRRIVLPKALGRAMAAAGAGAGLTARNLGDAVGEEKHTLTIAETASHHHALAHTSGINVTDLTAAQGLIGYQGGVNGYVDVGGVQFVQDTGGGTPFNVMQPTSFVNFMVKL